MAIINGRPITLQNMNDPETLTPLTPNHLLTFKSNGVAPPPGHFDIYSRKRWRRVQEITNEFWQRWKKEFVLTLQLDKNGIRQTEMSLLVPLCY